MRSMCTPWAHMTDSHHYQMFPTTRLFIALACTLLTLTAVAEEPTRPTAPGLTQALGPDAIPEQLPGVWRVGLCIKGSTHAWIRFENVNTGEVHTVGRYAILAGGRPPVTRSGLQWDRDLRREEDVRAGKYLLLTVEITDPKIYRGLTNGYGHGLIKNNCATYARDAWRHYSGETYRLSFIETPQDLLARVLERHPERKPRQ